MSEDRRRDREDENKKVESAATTFTAITASARAAQQSAPLDKAPCESTTRKVAKGQSMRHPVDVKLHSNDFDFNEYKRFCEEREKKEKEQQQQPASVDGTAAAAAAAASTATATTTTSKAAAAAAELQGGDAESHLAAQGAAWEKHYVQTRNNFFPIKNYLTQAFRSVVLPLFPRDQQLSEEERLKQEAEAGGEQEEDSSAEKNKKNDDDDDNGSTTAVSSSPPPPSRFVVECGCGTGSALLPLMNCVGQFHKFAGFDISKTAVQLFEQHEIVQTKMVPINNKPILFEHDVAVADIPENLIPAHSADIVLLIFVLNAIDRAKMPAVLRRLRAIMKPGGKLLFRDHGELDNSFFRFKKNGNKTCHGSFVKGDSTQQYFFSIDEAKQLFGDAGFAVDELLMHTNQVTNRKTQVSMMKILINGIFSAK